MSTYGDVRRKSRTYGDMKVYENAFDQPVDVKDTVGLIKVMQPIKTPLKNGQLIVSERKIRYASILVSIIGALAIAMLFPNVWMDFITGYVIRWFEVLFTIIMDYNIAILALRVLLFGVSFLGLLSILIVFFQCFLWSIKVKNDK